MHWVHKFFAFERGFGSKTADEWRSSKVTGQYPRGAVGEIKRAQARDGFQWRTVERAASEMGVLKKREGFGPKLLSTWSLAPLPPTPEHSRQPKLVAGMAFRGANDDTEIGEL